MASCHRRHEEDVHWIEGIELAAVDRRRAMSISSPQLISELGLPQINTGSRVADNVFSEDPDVDGVMVGVGVPDHGRWTWIPAPDRNMALRVVNQQVEAG